MRFNGCHSLEKMVHVCFLGVAVGCVALPVQAGTMGNDIVNTVSPWSITGSLGYTVYNNMFRDDGQTALGRFAIGRDIYSNHALIWGAEVAVQSGNTMRYYPSFSVVEAMGGLPIQTTVKPMLDLLATVRTNALGVMPVFAQMKGGLAYRHWQINDRDSIMDKSLVAGEVQAGLGYTISDRAYLNLSYQGIFGSAPKFTLNADGTTGSVSNIPIQNGILLGLTLAV